VRHGNSVVRRELVAQLARLVSLKNVYGIGRHIRGHVTLSLVRRLARRMDVHHEMPDVAGRAELDLGVPAAHAREAVDTVDDDLLSLARYALDRNSVVTEARDEAVLLLRTRGMAADGCESDEHDVSKSGEV